MKLARWAGGIALFLLVGACGYYITAVLAGLIVGLRIASGDMTFADFSNPSTQSVIEAVSALAGAALAWFLVGRRYWRRGKKRPSPPQPPGR